MAGTIPVCPVVPPAVCPVVPPVVPPVVRTAVLSVTYDGFEIQSAACQRGAMWYPEYEISLQGLVVSPWQTPAIDGRSSETAACDWGIQLAMSDIDVGLKRLFAGDLR